ncbi:cytochrome P450 [Xylariaceae sp. FL0804]|nr:cytochrome P450 [Xylariaceae sp. FL0804]
MESLVEGIQRVEPRIIFYSVVGLALVAAFIKRYVLPTRLDLPVFGSRFDPNPRNSILKAESIMHGEPYFVLSGQKPKLLILPMSVFEEVNHLPDDAMSFKDSIKQIVQPRHTGGRGGDKIQELEDAVRIDLTRNLNKLQDLIQDEARHAVADSMPDSTEWTKTNQFVNSLRLVAQLSGRIFVGLPLCREKEWIDTMVNFVATVAQIRNQAFSKHWLVRPFVLPYLPAIKETRRLRQRVKELLEPQLLEVLAEAAMQEKTPDNAVVAADQMGGDFLRWVTARMPEEHRETAQRLGDYQLVLSFAAIHTTSTTTTAVMMDLATYPKYIPLLRQEIEDVIKEEGLEENDQGQIFFPKRALAKLKKLDSFIKESQRWSPMGYTITGRKAMTDVKLSTGLVIPKGTMISFPQHYVHHSPETTTMSPSYNAGTGNPGPDAFEGFRFLNLREVPGRASRHQAVTTSEDSLTFGHGPKACPGRFFAVMEIKATLVDILRHYDIRHVGDVEGKGGEGRRPAAGAPHGMNRAIDRTCELEIRRRTTV